MSQEIEVVKTKLLLVEDDPIDVMAFERYVKSEKLPYDLIIARSVAEATAALSSNTFDLIITDYALGDGTGFDVLTLGDNTPHIFVTGSGNEELALRALNDGALDYLVKDHGRSYLKCLPAAISSALRQKEMKISLESFQQTVGKLVSERDILLSALQETRRGEHEQRVRERLLLGNAVQSLEKVLGIVSHELRTPLAGIRAMAEFLVRDAVKTGNSAHDFLQSICDETIRMNSIVNDLLEVARLNSGIAQWNWSTFSVTQACQEAVASLMPLVDSKRVNLTYDVEPKDLTMSGDKNAVSRLVLNLLTNAHKHTADGAISVSCRAQPENDSHWIELKFIDNGAGIGKETLAKLGQAFSLNSGLIAGDYVQGSGLGLTICKGIIAAHGGSLQVESEVGKGTVITVMLRGDLLEPTEMWNSELPEAKSQPA